MGSTGLSVQAPHFSLPCMVIASLDCYQTTQTMREVNLVLLQSQLTYCPLCFELTRKWLCVLVPGLTTSPFVNKPTRCCLPTLRQGKHQHPFSFETSYTIKVCGEFRATSQNLPSNRYILCTTDPSSHVKEEPQKVLAWHQNTPSKIANCYLAYIALGARPDLTECKLLCLEFNTLTMQINSLLIHYKIIQLVIHAPAPVTPNSTTCFQPALPPHYRINKDLNVMYCAIGRQQSHSYTVPLYIALLFTTRLFIWYLVHNTIVHLVSGTQHNCSFGIWHFAQL